MSHSQNQPLRPLVRLTRDEWLRVSRRLDLTRQQSAIVAQLLRGQGDKQIAGAMKISVPTLRTHLARMFRKLEISGRLELILCVFAVLREESK